MASTTFGGVLTIITGSCFAIRGLVSYVTWTRAYCHVGSYQKARASPCNLHAAVCSRLISGDTILLNRDNLHADRGTLQLSKGTLQLSKGTLQLSGGTLHDAGDNRGGRHAGEGGWQGASESGKKLFKISGFFLRRLAGKLYFCKIILRVLQDNCIFCKIIQRVLQDSCIFCKIILRVLQDSCIFCKIIPRVLQDSCIFAR